MSTVEKHKPNFDIASGLIEAAVKLVSDAVSVPLGSALGRRAAIDLVAPYAYPQTRLAGMDGKAVGADGTFLSDGILGTGEPVPEGTVRVVPVEEIEGRGEVAKGAKARTFVARRGSEYAEGDLLAGAGEVLDAACVSRLTLFGQEQVEVLRQPEVRVLTCGGGPRGGAVTAWLESFLRGLGDVHVTAQTLSSPATVAQAAEGADFVILASDSEPGRYGEMRRDLYDAPVSGWSPGFWKVGLHPCKHVGFGFAGDDVPVLVHPDVLSKTVLSALVFAPVAVDKLLGRQTHHLECSLTAELELGGPFPEAVPVRVELRDGELIARPLPVRDSFSARQVAPANGVIIAHAHFDLAHQYRVRFAGGGIHDSV